MKPKGTPHEEGLLEYIEVRAYSLGGTRPSPPSGPLLCSKALRPSSTPLTFPLSFLCYRPWRCERNASNHIKVNTEHTAQRWLGRGMGGTQKKRASIRSDHTTRADGEHLVAATLGKAGRGVHEACEPRPPRQPCTAPLRPLWLLPSRLPFRLRLINSRCAVPPHNAGSGGVQTAVRAFLKNAAAGQRAHIIGSSRAWGG